MNEPTSLDILIIEDDADAAANVRDILELDGHRVATAGTAADALARRDIRGFAAIVLDRKLPDAVAEDLLPILRVQAPGAAVVVVTGYSDLQGSIAALRLGAADYILKPLNADELRSRVGRIAEARRIDDARRAAEERFRVLVEAAECLIVMLRPDRSIAYFSPFAERLTGYPAAVAVGRDYPLLLLPEADRRTIADGLVRAFEGAPTPGDPSPIACRDGSRCWIAWNCRALSDFEGGPALLMVGQDITHLRQAQERALQAERLAAIGQMVAGLAHESRNALQRSQACLEMLARRARDRPEELDLIDRIQKAQDHLHHLYEDVRGYAAPILLERRECDLAEVWREAWADLEGHRRGRDATLREDPGGASSRCTADSFRMKLVFGNILENALAACPDPVVVRVRCAPSEVDGRPGLLISIVDNGPGLGPEASRKIFEPFYTTKTRGTGLGMAIARRVVEAHGGRIAVDDGPGPGAEVLITLPTGEP